MPPEKRNNRIAVYFTKSELSELESEKDRLNEDSTSKVVVKIVKEYLKNKDQAIVAGVAESASKYTTEDYDKAIKDDLLRAEILRNNENPMIKLLFIELEQLNQKEKKRK